jgi:guanylate kinase
VQGAAQVRKTAGVRGDFYFAAVAEELERRLRSRGQDPDEEIARLAKAGRDCDDRQILRLCVVNEDVERADVSTGDCNRPALPSARRRGRVEKLLASFGKD